LGDGSMTQVIINENSAEGFQDLQFNIVQTKEDQNFISFSVRGNYDGQLVGFNVLMLKGMQPGVLDNENFSINKDAFYAKGIIIRRTGKESDAFITILSSLYGISTKNNKMRNEVEFTSFALEGNPMNYVNENIKFKVFFDENDDRGLYSEAYINVNYMEGILEFHEKDIEYRNNLVEAMSKKSWMLF
jgi:hypothetical protein